MDKIGKNDDCIVGFIKIINGLRLTSECLGKSFDININDVNGILLIPCMPSNNSVAPDSMPDLIQPKSHFQFNDDLSEWGQLYSWPSCESNIDRVMVEFKYNSNSETDQIETKIQEGIGNWIIRFRENLFAFEYIIDSPGFKVINSIKDDYELYYSLNNNDRSRKALLKDPHEIYVQLDEQPITLKDLEKTIRITSENKHLILEYQLLKDAKQSLMNDNYRKCVLDCATALELCLTNVLKKDLPIKGDLLDTILIMNNSICKKRDLMKFTQHVLPKYKYNTDIEGLRNRAIHIGKTPTESEAKKAYEIVKEVVDKLTVEKFE